MTTPNTNVGEAKFTPGPWAAFNTFGKDIYPKDGDMEALRHIAELCPEGFENDRCVITYEEAKANAHLIASAPQMFEALEEVSRLVDVLPKEPKSLVIRLVDIERVVLPIIALARGEAHAEMKTLVDDLKKCNVNGVARGESEGGGGE